MRHRERTVQQLDPIGILSGYPIVLLIGAGAIVYALYSTVQQAGQISRPLLAVEALVLVAATIGYFILAAGTTFAPLSAASHAAIMTAALLAASLFTASLWGTNRLVQDDWGQIVVALLLFGLALFRPPWEIVVSATASALVLGATAMAESSFLQVKNSPWVYGTVVAGPVLILALGGAAYARVVIAALVDWQARARAAAKRLEPELRDSAARMLHQDQVSMLNAEAVPFLSRILQHDRIEEEDLARAREIAGGLRRRASADARGSWLRNVLGPHDRIHDPRALADQMDDDQRAILTAYLKAVRQLSPVAGAVVVDVAESSGRYLCAVSARSQVSDLRVRLRLVPYLSVLRQTSAGARLRVRRGHVSLRFEYVAS